MLGAGTDVINVVVQYNAIKLNNGISCLTRAESRRGIVAGGSQSMRSMAHLSPRGNFVQ